MCLSQVTQCVLVDCENKSTAGQQGHAAVPHSIEGVPNRHTSMIDTVGYIAVPIICTAQLLCSDQAGTLYLPTHLIQHISDPGVPNRHTSTPCTMSVQHHHRRTPSRGASTLFAVRTHYWWSMITHYQQSNLMAVLSILTFT